MTERKTEMEMNRAAWTQEQVVERISLTSTVRDRQRLEGGLSEAGLERGFFKTDQDLVLSQSAKTDINGHPNLLKSVNKVITNPRKLIPMSHPPSLNSLGAAVYKSNKNGKLEPEAYKAELANMLEAATSLGEALQSFSPTEGRTLPTKFRAMRRNSFVVHRTTPGQAMCLAAPQQISDQGRLYVERFQPCRPIIQASVSSSPRDCPAVTQFVPDQKSRKFRAVRRNSVVIHCRPGQDGMLPCLEERPKTNCAQPACTPSRKESDESPIQIQTNEERRPRSPSEA